MSEGKTASELMEILRDKHNIDISGSKHKEALLKMGYFHGFKGYRYLRTPKNQIPYTHFDEVISVYQFDMKLKSLFYPQLMFIETAFKNVALDTIISKGSADFEDVFRNLLNDYERHEQGTSNYKRKMKNRLDLRTKIYSTISYNYNSNREIIQHFLHDNRPVPLWAIFEVINLGDFGFLINCLNYETRVEIAKNLHIHHDIHNKRGRVTEDVLGLIRDLRNAVAHNSVVFDCRYRLVNPVERLLHFLQAEMGIQNISFNTITDYVILITYIMKQVGIDQKDLRQVITTFISLTEQLKLEIPEVIFYSIIEADYLEKLNRLKVFIA